MAIENSGASQCARSAQPARSSDSRTTTSAPQDGRIRSRLAWEEGDGALLCALLMLISAPYVVLLLVSVGPLALGPLLSLLRGMIH